MPDDSAPDDAEGLRAANARLRAVVETKAAEIEVLRAELDAERELRRRQELRLAELERRLGMDSSDSGTPSSKERIGAKEARRARQQSERERRKDRKRGGQPGHQGKGLDRDPDPGERKDAAPPAECRSCRASLAGAEAAASRWAQVIDVEFTRKVTEWALPGLSCPCCGAVTFAAPPPGAHAGAVSYGPVLNAAAVLLTCYGNVPPERTAQVIGMLLGIGVSAGWVDKAAARVSAQLGKAGFDDAMIAALAGEDVLAADETPVSVLDKTAPAPPGEDDGEKDPEEKDGKAAPGAPHVLITRTPDGRLTFLRAMASRRKAALAAGLPASFTGYLITDGYTGYQHLLTRLAGIQQCCATSSAAAARSRNSAPEASRTGPATSSRSSATPTGPSMPPAPAGTPPWTSRYSMTCANATTPRSAPGSSTTGSGTGTTGTTPATPSAPGCGTTRNRSSCSPATSASPGRTTSANAARKPRNDTRPSPATGTP